MIVYYQLSGFNCSSLASHVNTHTCARAHTHSANEGRGSFTSEAAMTLEANIRLEAWLVHLQLPPPPCPEADLAPTIKRYQIQDLRSPPVSVLCSYGNFSRSTLSSSLPAFPRSPPSLAPSHSPAWIPIHRHGFHVGRAE